MKIFKIILFRATLTNVEVRSANILGDISRYLAVNVFIVGKYYGTT